MCVIDEPLPERLAYHHGTQSCFTDPSQQNPAIVPLDSKLFQSVRYSIRFHLSRQAADTTGNEAPNLIRRAFSALHNISLHHDQKKCVSLESPWINDPAHPYLEASLNSWLQRTPRADRLRARIADLSQWMNCSIAFAQVRHPSRQTAFMPPERSEPR